MNWQEILAAAEAMKVIEAGHTVARRGIATLPDGRTAFVKLSTDADTKEWMQREIEAYHWLESHRYPHAPLLLAEGPEGFALPDLSALDWTDHWTEAKLAAVLRAVDELADMSAIAGTMESADFGDNPWAGVPRLTGAYTQYINVSNDLIGQLEVLFADQFTCLWYEELANSEPWRGTQLVHNDVRADNFGYDATTDRGMLIDWNWLSLGSAKLDQTTLLVNVYKLGSPELIADQQHRLDLPSLAWFVGFCLKFAASPADTPNLQDLRLHQLKTALAAHELAAMIR